MTELSLWKENCYRDIWRGALGVYWACSGGDEYAANINMSPINTGRCSQSSGEMHRISEGNTATFTSGSNRYTVKMISAYRYGCTVDISKVEVKPDDFGFGFGRAEITQTNIGPGTVFNVNSNINYSLRVMNTGDSGKIYGVIGLGYHDKDGNVYFTGRYAKEEAQVSSGQTITWNADITVLHKDYAAREMTPHGPAMYFMSGHDENGNIVWDRSEYIPVELILESGYVDPTDPDGVPDDWADPIPGDSRPEPEEEPIDIMPFIYIGLMGLIGYLLMKGH